MAQQKIVQTAGRQQLGEFAPEFARLNDDVLFGEVWSRNDLLSLRDRSLVTITSLIAQGIIDNSLVFHLESAKKNGITRTEISEIITHIAFYAGWPKAWAAFNLAKTVWADDIKGDDPKTEFARSMIFPIGEPNTVYEQYFTGKSYLARISDRQIPFANVTLSRDAATTGMCIRPGRAAGRCLSELPGADGIRKRVSLQSRYCRARWCIFPPTLSIGMARQRIHGSPISRFLSPARMKRMNGSNP